VQRSFAGLPAHCVDCGIEDVTGTVLYNVRLRFSRFDFRKIQKVVDDDNKESADDSTMKSASID
jgi:hypothetical protein